MAQLADVELHQRALDDLATLAQRELLALWLTLDVTDAGAVSAALQAALPDLVDAYGAAAAALAADWFDQMRADAGAPGSFTAVPAAPPPIERSAVLARWAVGPLFGAAPDAALVLSRLSGGLQRQVVDSARSTVEASVAADPAAPRYARHASANACAFCALMASRGPVYRSEATAGADYHDHCHCVAVPVWGDDYQPAPYVAKWQRAYRDATRATADGGPIDVSKVLAHMRVSLGTH